ncbi:MAG: YCF48-related protein [candidate division WOR-3 bacterium]
MINKKYLALLFIVIFCFSEDFRPHYVQFKSHRLTSISKRKVWPTNRITHNLKRRAIRKTSSHPRDFTDWDALGPEGANVTSMVMHPSIASTIYLAHSGYPCQIYKTTNSASNWNVVGTVEYYINSMAISTNNPNILYATGFNDSSLVFKSTDGGQNWTYHQFAFGDNDWDWIYALAVDPSNANIVWGAADYYYDNNYVMAYYKSTDGGISWVGRMLDSTTYGASLSIAINPSSPNTVYIGGTTGNGIKLFKTTNGGTNWTDLSANLSGEAVLSIAIHPTQTNTILVGTYYGIYRSTDGGMTWNPTNFYNECPVIKFSPNSPNIVYAGSYDGNVYKSTDAGQSWNPTGSGISGYEVRNLLIDLASFSIVYVGTELGCYKTTNSGTYWQSANTGLYATAINCFTLAPSQPNTIYLAVDGDALYKSTNMGINWTRLPEFTGSNYIYSLAVAPNNPNIVYALYYYILNKSTDGGQNWTEIYLDDYFWPEKLAINPSNASIIYISGTYYDTLTQTENMAILKSTDAGNTWSIIPITPNQSHGYSIAIDPSNPNTIYVGGEEQSSPALFKSTNAGMNWIDVSYGIYGWNIYAMAVNPLNSNIIYVGTEDGIFKSTTGGTNWQYLGVENITSIAINPSNPNTIYTGTYNEGVYKSTDGGNSWYSYNQGLSCWSITGLAIHPTYTQRVYAGTYGGSLNGQYVLEIDEEHLTMNTKYSILKIYPNPAKTFLNINCPITTNNSTLKIFDISGKLIKEIKINQPENKISLRDLDAGIYYLQLNKTIKKITIIK